MHVARFCAHLASSLLLGAALACGPSASPAGGSTSKSASQEVRITGVVTIPKPDTSHKGKKIFSGVMIEADGGPTWVVTYSSNDLWKAFEGRRVQVTGESYVPQEQAIVAPHVRVKSLTLEHSDETAMVTRVGEELTMEGQFLEVVWPPGTALAGEKSVRFVTVDGRELLLWSKRPEAPLGQTLSVRGRIVEPSPYAARPLGAYVWIEEIVGPEH